MSVMLLGGLILGVAAFVLVAKKIEYGLYALAATAFLSGWHLTFGGETLRGFFSLPLVSSFVAGPLVDFLAIFVCAALVLGIVIGAVQFDRDQARALGAPIVYFVLFIVSACASAVMVYHGQVFSSFKYVLRPQVFVFVCFFVVPVLLLQRRAVLRMVLWIWFWLGAAVTVYGLSSLFFAHDLYRWVTPYPILDFAPLGDNHNQIAETLLAIIPLSLVLYIVNRKKASSHYLLGALAVMWLTALLTLSRALWLVMGCQIVAVAVWYRAALFKLAQRVDRRVWYGVGLAICGIVIYMLVYLLSAVPASSNNSRNIMNMIVLSSAVEHPLFGVGPGTFTTLMQETPAYVQAFSKQLDAHGFVQKILLEQGILGLVTWLAFVVGVLGYVYEATLYARTKEQILVARLFLLTACGVVAFQLFNTSYYLATLWLPLAVCFAGASLLRLKKW